MTSPEQYAETLTLAAMRLIAAVHHDGPTEVAEAIHAAHDLPAPAGVDPAAAFAAVLAAAIPSNRTRTQLWGWTLGNPRPGLPTGAQAHDFAVTQCIAGVLPLHALSPAEQEDVVAALRDGTHGAYTLAEIADTLHTDLTTIRAIRARTDRRHGARKGTAA